MLTFKDHAIAAIKEYREINQIKSEGTLIISALREDTDDDEFQQGIYVVNGDEGTLYLVTQYNDRDIPQTDLQVYKQVNHLVF